MKITHPGHSLFLIELRGGATLALDPYGRDFGYPTRAIRADAVLCSHGHGDHHGLDMLQGDYQLVETEGEHALPGGAKATMIASFHDDAQGAKRGPNLLTVIEAEGLRVAHLGDLGCPLTEAQLAALGRIDVLMLPVGGFYTIDAQTALAQMRRIRPNLCVPMHYATAVNADWPIAKLEGFASLLDSPPDHALALDVSSGALPAPTRVLVLDELA